MSNKDDLNDRISKMCVDECWQYHSSAKGMNTLIDIFGVGLFVLILSIPTVLCILIAGIAVSLLAKLSSNIDETINKIEDRLRELIPED